MREPELCRECEQRILCDEIEEDTGVCMYCADKLAARYQQRREFAEWHDDDTPTHPEGRNE